MKVHFILYVRDQAVSTEFYRKILALEPTLNVPGMTEFRLPGGCVLGLMPDKGIKRLLGETIQDPETTNGASRAEIYLVVDNPTTYFERATHLKAKILSPMLPRNWGDEAAYVADPDGHVVAFASSGVIN